MTLGELIKRLEAADQNFVVKHGFGEPMSYRGHYEQLAFEPKDNVTVGSMLKHAKSAVNKVFYGYKGGEYKMDLDTPVWIAHHGSSGEEIGATFLSYMLEQR